MKFSFSIDMAEHRRMVRRVPMERRRKLQFIMKEVGTEAVNKITSLTGKMQPAIKQGQGPRRAHPGGWADRTTQLVRSISHRLDVSRGSITLLVGVMQDRGVMGVAIDDVVEYAVHLDNMEGYSVLAGIPEQAFRSLVSGLKKVYHV